MGVGSDPNLEDSDAVTAAELLLGTLLADGADNAEVGIFIYDDRGAYVAANRYAAELLGYTREELLTRHVGDFSDGRVDLSVLDRLERRQGTRVVRRKDGSELSVSFVVAPTRVSTFSFFFAVVWEVDAE
jgi:PAS domain S-box-containing protein